MSNIKRVKYTEMLSSDGKIKFEGVMDSDKVEVDFSPNFYTYLKFFNIGGRFEIFVNGQKIELLGMDIFEIENLDIYSLVIRSPFSTLITEDMVTEKPTQYRSEDISKYYIGAYTDIQYILMR